MIPTGFQCERAPVAFLPSDYYYLLTIVDVCILQLHPVLSCLDMVGHLDHISIEIYDSQHEYNAWVPREFHFRKKFSDANYEVQSTKYMIHGTLPRLNDVPLSSTRMLTPNIKHMQLMLVG